jgi:ParB family transcriptional regulator, chromosome partitioning protein
LPKPDLKPPTILRTEDMELAKLVLDDTEVARHVAEQTELLAQNMAAHGLLQPVAVTEDGRVIFGHGRILAARLLCWKCIRASVYAKGLSPLQFRLIRASENLQRNELTAYRRFRLCHDLMTEQGWDQQTLAAFLNQNPATTSRNLSPAKLPSEWIKALEDERVPLSACYAASKADKSKHAGLLALAIGGANREALEKAGRGTPANNPDAVRLSRVKVALPSKVSITVAGESLSLDELIEALAEAQREAKRAREQGLDAKTFQAVMRDKARA